MTTPFKNKKGPAFEYPKLKDPEIVSCLHQLSIEVTPDFIKNITPEMMRQISDELVAFMVGYTREEIRAAPPQFAAMELMTHPELHDESVVESTMNKAWLKLLRASGISDATLTTDLWNPTPARARLLFSAVINFARFKMDRLQPFEKFAIQTRQLVELKQKLEAELEKLKQTIAELQAQRVAEEPVIAELDKENVELANKLHTLGEAHRAGREEATKLKVAAAEYDAKIKEETAAYTEVNKENEKLKSQIVRSPERMKKSIFDMKSTVEAGKREIAELDVKTRDLRAKSQTLETLCEKIDKRVSEMTECSELKVRSKKLFKEVNDAGQALQTSETKITELASELKRYKTETSRVAQKLFTLQEQFTAKHKQVSTALAATEADRAALLREKEKDNKKIEENESLIQQKKNEMARMEKAHRDELNGLKETYQEFCSSLRGYHEKLLEAMG